MQENSTDLCLHGSGQGLPACCLGVVSLKLIQNVYYDYYNMQAWQIIRRQDMLVLLCMYACKPWPRAIDTICLASKWRILQNMCDPGRYQNSMHVHMSAPYAMLHGSCLCKQMHAHKYTLEVLFVRVHVPVFVSQRKHFAKLILSKCDQTEHSMVCMHHSFINSQKWPKGHRHIRSHAYTSVQMDST